MAATKRTEGAGKTVEVDGIRVTVLADVSDDFEIVEAVYTSNDPESTPAERGRARLRMYRALLGADYRRAKDELRAKNGGRLPTQAFLDFCEAVIREAGDAKN